MATKRAGKLQEFVAHSANVNCAKFGKQTSKILVTGGEDQKVNLWAIGKPSSILSLSGFTSPIESVSFDSSEVMIGAGAASGTIKIWDIEEAKVVRTFTGHRSNCASLDFHPFGEFFASGSSDTNMKIWDMRKKICIHTYKGHTRRIDVLRFTPDGRWIVSGGADNSVKIWDLTAGKLLHDFRLHEGPVNCLAFHPHEFLLATGSSDKTVKFWDLETFELIGSSGPENCREYFVPASVVRAMTFNSDGKALFCGLHENLKVLSWEPIICHDVVDVGWSTLADLTVQEGKLLGCSYNQSCVGIWVVDLMKIEPYAFNNAKTYLNGSVNRPIQADDSISPVFRKLSVSRSPGPANYKRSQYAPTLDGSRRRFSIAGKQTVLATDEDAIADLMKNHQEFIHGLKSRLTKLEVVHQCWQNEDIKGSIDAARRMLDHAVTADIVNVLTDNTTKCITLDICTYVLPLASNLLDSRYDRHLNIALQMILKLVKSFGATISSTLSAAPPVGVDLEAEQRLERCTLCFQELKKVDASLISLTRRQGEVGRSAQELSLFLQDILQVTSSV